MSRPPTDAAAAPFADDRRRRDRVRAALVVAATVMGVVVLATSAVGVSRSLADDDRGAAPAPIAPTPVPSAPSSASPSETLATPAPTAPATGPLTVSGAGVGGLAFGTEADEVVDAVTARFGEPDVSVRPTAYSRVRGSDGWFEVADDPLSPSWRHRVLSVSCWDTLCLLFGGSAPDALQLRGWELSELVRWSGTGRAGDRPAVDVRLAGTGVRLGDRWAAARGSYPGTTVGGGEGASVTVRDLPWPGVFDGVGEWRLSGPWDPTRPAEAPPGARLTRLSGGEGPEPGCC